MRAYSLDLRERIVGSVEGGERKVVVAERFGVSLSSVKRYVKRAKEERLEADKRPGQKPWLDAPAQEALAQQVKDHPDWTLEQRAAGLHEGTGVALKKSAVSKYLKRLGIAHKKRASFQVNETNKSVKPIG